jgi:pimeloyl-ACP methyl ester carboxylesterase
MSETIVLLHGSATGSSLWDPVGGSLVSSGASVFAPEMLGYGQSPAPTSSYGIAEEVAHLVRLLDLQPCSCNGIIYVRSFARTWTTDLKDRRIRVNAVSPGSTDILGLSDLLASAGAGEQRKKMISNSVPLGRFGTPDEIAKAVVFLASDDSSYIAGTELFVDGGFAQV